MLAIQDANGALIALAPWHLQRHVARGNVVEFLGSGEVCSDYLTVLCRPGTEAEASTALADWLVQSRKTANVPRTDGARWDRLEFRGIPVDDVAMNRLVERLAQRGALVDRRSMEHCWRLELPACWEDYLRTLSKSHRKQLRRFQRRLFDTGRAVLHTANTAAEVEYGLELLIDLHQRRRRSLGQRGCFENPRFTAFLRDAARQFFELGQLWLCWLELDSRPIACEYQLLGERTVYAYQSGIEPAVLGEEPGRLATLAVLQAAVKSGHRTYDLLRGDEAYKAHLRARPRACVDIRVLPGEGADWVRHRVWVARENVKYWAKGAWQWAGALRPRGSATSDVSRSQK
ncbi:MAG TPA: GNAT family N-acetyltransferase [Pirellulales bacterium]|nr:GNAT family N-acetyltransferase [Pirellulales bacterium]